VKLVFQGFRRAWACELSYAKLKDSDQPEDEVPGVDPTSTTSAHVETAPQYMDDVYCKTPFGFSSPLPVPELRLRQLWLR
jgi:hypothetical protein